MKKSRRKYDRDFKLMAVSLSYKNGNMAQTARDLQIDNNLLFLWRKDCKKYGTASFPGGGNKTLSSEERKIYDLEKKIKETDLKFEIIQQGRKYVCLGKPFIFHFVKENEKKYTARLICDTLGVNKSRYYIWKQGLLTKRQKRYIILKKEVSSIFTASKETYGAQRIKVELEKRGYFFSHLMILKCMRELGIYVSVKKNNLAVRKTKITDP